MKRLNPADCRVLQAVLGRDGLTFIDVGAAGGIEPLWREYAGTLNLRCFGFEPSPENFAALKSDPPAIQYYPFAILDRVGPVTFYAFNTIGSLHHRGDHAGRGEVFTPITVQGETLAHLREQAALPSLDAIKIDVEGHEIDVLRGAGSFLRDETLYVKAEFTFERTGGNSFCVIDSHLTEHALLLFSFSIGSSKVGNVTGGDCLYLKNINALIRSSADAQATKVRVLKLIAISVICHHLNYAFYCAGKAHEAGVLDRSEYDELSRFITRGVFVPAALPAFFARPKIARALFLLSELFGGNMARKRGLPKENTLHGSTKLWTQGAMPASFRRRAEAEWRALMKIDLPD